jgi:hypothetical protein
VSIDASVRDAMLGLVPEVVAAVRAELERPRLLPIKSAPVAYRAILDAERRGELAVFRVGHASFVDEAELFAWIRRVGTPKPESEQRDAVAELIALGDARRNRRPRSA